MFPNQTLSHIINLEDQTLERFAFLLEDDQILSRAYESFKVTIIKRLKQLFSYDMYY